MFFRNKDHLQPLEKRTFRFKNPAVEFFCPLCRTKRAITVHHRLTVLNYIQIVAISAVLSVLFWPLMEVRSLFSFFIVWTGFEGVRRMLWRKQIPCPHCGFDASWYKTDVTVARQKVEDFWQSKKAPEGKAPTSEINDDASTIIPDTFGDEENVQF